MYTYLALGDSYTIGEQVPTIENFPHQLVTALQKMGIKTAQPVIIAQTGWTTDELAAAIREAGITETFSFVTLLIGVNNQYRGRELADYEKEFTDLLLQAIAFANNNAQHVFVLSIPDWGVTPFAEGKDRSEIAQKIDAYNASNKKITHAHNAHWLDITDSTRRNGSDPTFLAADGLHPSGREYAIWTQRLQHEVAATLKT